MRPVYPSLPVTKEYTVEFPVEDAPAVTPSTGQYEQPTQIVIQVPDGYTAYYTMDKSDPSEASTKYTGPIDMPEGNTIFKAVLVNGKGKADRSHHKKLRAGAELDRTAAKAGVRSRSRRLFAPFAPACPAVFVKNRRNCIR